MVAQSIPVMILLSKEQSDNLRRRFSTLYGEENAPRMMDRFHMMLGRYGVGENPSEKSDLWSEKDSILITYADSIRTEDEFPLETLRKFLGQHAKDAIRCVHLLPFFPWTSDDGFSVADYRKVKSEYGCWRGIEAIGNDFDLMFDFVLNHCSRKSSWFREFVMGVDPGKDYFLATDPEEDLSEVVRPRTTPLLTKTATRHGDKWVWATFGSDQIDLNWQNSDLLFEFLDILFLYLSKGARILRLDAVAFLWKKIGTSCLHLPETHEVVKLFRDVLEIVSPETILLTETNVPHRENLSYFGDGDEAHMVYNFSLPPLLLHGLLKGNATLLKQWAKTLPRLPEDQTFLNFTASHDGIGVRPLQGIVNEKEIGWLISEVKKRGGKISTRTLADGSEAPYEMNISYVDALLMKGDEEMSIRRFLCSQAVMLSLPGIPAVYIHSLLGTPNDREGFKKLGYNRALNRKKWDLSDLEAVLENPESKQARIFHEYLVMLRRRVDQPALHPAAEMEMLDLGREIFAFHRIERGSESGESLVCVFNFSEKPISLEARKLDDRFSNAKSLRDVLHGETIRLTKRQTFELKPYASHWLALRK